MLHLVGTQFDTIVDGILQVFEHIQLHGVLGGTGKVVLAIATQDGDISESLRQPIVGPGPEGAHLAAVVAVTCLVCPIGGIVVQALECGIGHLDDAI